MSKYESENKKLNIENIKLKDAVSSFKEKEKVFMQNFIEKPTFHS